MLIAVYSVNVYKLTNSQVRGSALPAVAREKLDRRDVPNMIVIFYVVATLL